MAGVNVAQGVSQVTGRKWRGVDYFCSTRLGGVSTGSHATMNLASHAQDDPRHVAENRRRLAGGLPGNPVWLNQVHGIHVFDADVPAIGTAAPIADAAITVSANRVLAIMTADCLPVVIADTEGRALAIAHAGWRGLANGVLQQTMQGLRHKCAGAVQWQAWIGPAISQHHFQVGADVYSAFVDRDSDAGNFFLETEVSGKWLADLPGLAMRCLQHEGVESIELSGYCTYGQPEAFYSYRRDPHTGRMATVAWLSNC